MSEKTQSESDVLDQVEAADVRFIRLWFTDILGRLKSFSVNAAALSRAFESGMAFDGASITGFNPVEESDMIAMPDPSTFSVIPWRPHAENAVGRMFCDILVPGGAPYEGDPRWILKRALKRAERMGFSSYEIAPEMEYFYFRSARPESGVPEPLDEGGYFDLTTLDAGSDVRRETVLAMEKMGMHVASTHHEAGPSQHEIDMRAADALSMADDCMSCRIVVREFAERQGWHATFMPKPLMGVNGSGMHLHQALLSGGENAFGGLGDGGGDLTETGKSFIAGQLKHAREIAPLFAQWVNSYKRLAPGFEAPVYLSWSRRNRSALIRVPQERAGGDGLTRAELRCPDPACNPYLCFAGMLQAGLEGVERGYELPEPMEENLYHLSPEELAHRGIERLPTTLGEAIELAADSELVLRTLGEHTLRRLVEIKRGEWDAARVQVTPHEVEDLLPIL